MLAREVLGHARQALVELLHRVGAELAVHQQQLLAGGVEAAGEVLAHHVAPEVAHHRAVGPPAEGLGDLEAVAVEGLELDDAQAVERGQVAPYKAFLGVSWLFLISSAFTLAKTLRDAHEAERFARRVEAQP